jgi:hypothetical protein
MRSRPGAAAVGLMVVAALLLAIRGWIALDHPLPLGGLGDPGLVRASKLSGWLTAGAGPVGWSWRSAGVAAFWELLPAAVFLSGLLLWLSHACARRLVRAPAFGPLFAFVSLLGVSAAISLYCFEGIPHVQDSIAQQLQAQIFASGRLYAPAPPYADQLANEFVIQDGGRWYAQYPPVQPALIALGLLAGAPWIVNPLLGAGAALCAYGAARRAYGRPTARLALALFCLSPFVWFMSGERMSHTSTLFLVSAALWAFSPAYARSPAAPGLVRVLLGGLCIGLAVSTRPLCGVAVGLAMALGLLLPTTGGRRLGANWVSMAVILAIGVFIGAAPLLGFNAWTTGSPLRSGYESRWGSSGWGFGTAQWGPPHTLEAGLSNTLLNWDAAGKYLLEWPFPTQLLLLGVLVFPRKTRMDAVLAAILVSLTLAYAPYFYQDLCLGPRFLYAGVPALIILSARGLYGFSLLLARRRGLLPRSGISLVMRAVVLCTVVGLAVNAPVLVRWYGDSFWGTDHTLTTAVRNAGLHRAVVFIQDYSFARRVRLTRAGVSWSTAQAAVKDLDEQWIDQRLDALGGGPALEAELIAAIRDRSGAHRRTRALWLDYRGPSSTVSLGFHANTPDPRSQDIIYAAAVDPVSDYELFRAYPGRTAWLYDYDPLTGGFTLTQRGPSIQRRPRR